MDRHQKRTNPFPSFHPIDTSNLYPAEVFKTPSKASDSIFDAILTRSVTNKMQIIIRRFFRNA